MSIVQLAISYVLVSMYFVLGGILILLWADCGLSDTYIKLWADIFIAGVIIGIPTLVYSTICPNTKIKSGFLFTSIGVLGLFFWHISN